MADESSDFTLPHANIGDFLVGIIDVLAHMGLAAIVSGVIPREALIEACAELEREIDHQAERTGISADPASRAARKLPAQVLGRRFAMPIAGERDFDVVVGGKLAPGDSG
jgi:hypothetical protein